MNKLLKMAMGIIIAMGMVGVAHADNKWTGFYVGADAGITINHVELKSQQLGFTNPSDTCNASSDFATFSPGIQLGYMYQFSMPFVLGIDANVTVNTNQKDTLSCNSSINSNVYDRFIFRDRMQTSVRGRVGYAPNWHKSILLPYLTAGASFVNVGLTYSNEGGDYYSKNTTPAGWLIGAGLEWAFRQDWSLRAEYYYANYGNTINLKIPGVYGLIDPNGHGRVNLSSNNVVVSVNYWIKSPY